MASIYFNKATITRTKSQDPWATASIFSSSEFTTRTSPPTLFCSATRFWPSTYFLTLACFLHFFSQPVKLNSFFPFFIVVFLFQPLFFFSHLFQRCFFLPVIDLLILLPICLFIEKMFSSGYLLLGCTTC